MANLEDKKKVLLINPPKDKKEHDYYTEFLPLNLIAIYTRLQLAGIDTDMIDCLPGTREIDQVMSQINAAEAGDLIVGISLYQSNAQKAVEIASECKKLQAVTNRKITIIIGGVNSTLFGQIYLQKYPELIDGVILGHGEDAMIDLYEGRTPSNLLTTEDLKTGTTVRPYYDTNLDAGFPYDYSGIDLRQYWQYAGKRFSQKGSRFELEQMDRPLLINTHRGCYLSCDRGQTIRKCIFCGQREFEWKGISPTQFWENLEKVMRETGANCVSDLGDNFLGNTEWFKKLMKNRPKGFPYPFKYIFASSDKLCDEETVELLAEELQLHAVLNSIEHGDERCQKALGKRYTAEETERSLVLLDKYKIASRLSFVIGAPRTKDFEGESEETIQKFIEFAKRIAERECVQVILGNVLNPSPGSKVYYLMMKHGKNRDLYKSMLPVVDQELMSRHYFEEFTNVSRERAEEAMKKIMDIFGKDVIKGETV